MKYFQLFILSCFILLSIPITAQETFYSQIDAKWKFEPNPEDRWSYGFSTKYLSDFYESGSFEYDTNYLQLEAAPTFSINSNHAVSLKFRYRIKKLFDSNRTDEKRLIQQYAHSHNLNKIKLKGRLRVEQRFREDFNLRNRYRIGITFALNKNPDKLKKWFLSAGTEFLWSISPKKHPTFDQRVTLTLEKPISKVFVLKLKPQYRYLDYTHEGEGVLRVYAILGIAF